MGKNCLIALFCCCWQITLAQVAPTDSLWIEAGNLRICLRADGSLYSGGPGGAVQYRHLTPQGEEKWVKVVQDAGIWFGGVDPGGSLLLSAQKFEPRATDFRAGFAGVPGSGKIWSVTRDQMAQHIADYADNAHVDQPIEAIFAWPGQGNRFFEQYNGFALPESSALHGNFTDLNWNGVYDPDLGEYPNYLGSTTNFFPVLPEQVYSFAFYTDSISIFEDIWLQAMPFQVVGQIFTFDCSESPVFENGFFTALQWEHIGSERIDSSIIGLYMNADIGNSLDDYHGSRWDSYFAYNATAVDSGGFGPHPPLLMVTAINTPLNEDGHEVNASMMPIWPANSADVPAAMTFPQNPGQYYNYLTAHWSDGMPLRIGGLGYNWMSGQETSLAFLGNPYTPGTWTELNTQNPPGDRRGLLSWHYESIRPKYRNRLTYMTVVYPRDSTQGTEDWYNGIVAEKELIIEGFTHGHEFTAPSCQGWPTSINPRRPPHPLIHPYPNPVSDILYIRVEGGEPLHLRLHDTYGHLATELQFPC
ncbi:MAG: hypothetical protein ACKVU2_09645, partial [Saprospiraceae bacterium]